MTSKQGITSPRAPTALAKTLNLGKWKKDANEGRSHPCEEYEVIGQGGSRDGVLLSRGEPFQRSWTILNSAVFANKAKSRVAKLIQTKGPPLKESLLFLWPPPGKCVEVTLELQAPNEAGWFEAAWKLEGSEQEEFCLKFEVLDLEFALPEEQSDDALAPSKPKKRSKMDQTKKGRRRKKRRSQTGEKKILRETLTSAHQNSVSTSAILPKKNRMRTVPLGSEERSSVEFALEEPIKLSQMRSLDSALGMPILPSREDSNEQKNQDVASPFTEEEEPRMDVLEERFSRRIAGRANTTPRSLVKGFGSPPPLVSSQSQSALPCPQPISPIASETGTPRKPTLVNRWQETVMNDETFKRSQFEKQRRELYVQRASSLLNTHMRKKSQLLSHSPQSSSVLRTPDRIRSSLALSSGDKSPIKRPDPDLIATAHSQLEQLIQSAHAFQHTFDLLAPFLAHQKLISPLLPCVEQLRTFLPEAERSQQHWAEIQTDMNTPSGETRLPASIWSHVFSYLSPRALNRVAQTCSLWRTLSEQDALWQAYVGTDLASIPDSCQFVTEKTKKKDLCKAETLFNQWETRALTDSPSLTQSDPLIGASGMWPVYDLQLHGDILVTVSDDITVMDTRKRRIRSKLAGHEKVIQCVHVDERGEQCVTGSADKTVKVWSLSQQECLYTLEGHSGAVNDVCQLGDVIVSTSMHDKVVRFWTPHTGQFAEYQSMEGVTRVAADPLRSSSRVYLGTVDGQVIEWDVEVQQAIQSRQVATGMVEDLQVNDGVIVASDYTRIIIQSLQDPSLECLSPMMTRNVGRVQRTEYSLGAQVGNKLSLFDVRYLFNRHIELPVDGVWKGAFCFDPSGYLMVASGTGQVYQWPVHRK